MSFREGFVDADGFRIRYLEAGEGPVLVHIHGAGGCGCIAGTKYWR
jgi:pimeloyl-ACP methyl ester carboxylesterase